jgi:hypothetical protein
MSDHVGSCCRYLPGSTRQSSDCRMGRRRSEDFEPSRRRRLAWRQMLAVAFAVTMVAACGSDSPSSDHRSDASGASGGATGSGGVTGSGGNAGSGGAAGSTAGSAGAGGTAASGGSAGAGGTAGTSGGTDGGGGDSGAGRSGSAGTNGASGAAGSGGQTCTQRARAVLDLRNRATTCTSGGAGVCSQTVIGHCGCPVVVTQRDSAATRDYLDAADAARAAGCTICPGQPDSGNPQCGQTPTGGRCEATSGQGGSAGSTGQCVPTFD